MLELDELELLDDEPPETHCPAWQVVAAGQIMPVQGSLPHAPVTGSHRDPSVHGFGLHLSVTHVGVACARSQVRPAAHAGSHVATHSPSTHVWPVPHILLPQTATHVGVVKSAEGLHA